MLILSCSGTGGLEAAIVNFLSPGDSVLSVSIGVFGDRFAKIATRYGADVTKLDVEWGQAADPAAVSAALRAAGRRPAGQPAKAVLLTHNETSTGVTNPLEELAAAVHAAAPGRADPRRRHQRPRRGPLRDRRLGPRRRRHRLAEELDGAARPGHGERLAACLGGLRARHHAALLLRPRGAPRQRRQGRDALDAGRRGLLRAGRRARPDRGRGLPRDLRAPRRLRCRRPRGPERHGHPALRRPGARVEHRDERAGPRRRRMVRPARRSARAGSCWPAARAP